MIYKNPKSIINKYYHQNSGKTISELELFRKIKDSISVGKEMKQSSPEVLENEYVAEFIRRKLRKSPSKKGILRSINRLVLHSPTEMRVEQVKGVGDGVGKEPVFPRIKSAKRIRFTSHNGSSSSSTPQNLVYQRLPSREKIRITPKDKANAMYKYELNVRSKYLPKLDDKKLLEAELRSFSCERLKTFKDFQIVKLFK